MTPVRGPIILASRSPRRLELLRLLLPHSEIVVQPPLSAAESGFDGLTLFPEIVDRVREIAEAKRANVEQRLARPWKAVIAADTVIVGESDDGVLAVLGQPPPPPAGLDVVQGWFRDFYFGRTHRAVSAVSVSTPNRPARTIDVTTRVTFSREREGWLGWYLASGESQGKAGGYALQGLAGVFVEKVEGSLSSVVGLPLAETWELLAECEPLGGGGA